MPSVSEKQKKLMAAVAHGWKPSNFKGPSKAVAEEFNEADTKGAKPKPNTKSAGRRRALSRM
jgi:hypothetical protein